MAGLAKECCLIITPRLHCPRRMWRYDFAACAYKGFFFRLTFWNQLSQNGNTKDRGHDDPENKLWRDIHIHP